MRPAPSPRLHSLPSPSARSPTTRPGSLRHQTLYDENGPGTATRRLSRRSQFERLLALHPQVNALLLASLAAQVNRLSEHLLEVLFSPTPHRVQRRLLILAEEFDGEPIAITQADLALMAGTTRTTVNEILRDLERRGTIRIGRGRLEVLDRIALARRVRG